LIQTPVKLLQSMTTKKTIAINEAEGLAGGTVGTGGDW
jgi:hypothetical protein